MRAEKTAVPDLLLHLCCEAKTAGGEDSYSYSFSQCAGMLSVFDGCGGLGAQRHGFYTDHTEAYMASRLCAGAFYDAFMALAPRHNAPDFFREYKSAAEDYSARSLSGWRPPAATSVVKGTMVKTLPTTAACALVQRQKNGALALSALWAGDSRIYLLDGRGLAQLTVDDTTVPDPMDNLYEDGVLRKVLSAERRPSLHCKAVRPEDPFLMFAATDGCFGYFSTPMEFEGVLLETLQTATCIARWEELLRQRLGAVAGDDFTLLLAGYGFSSFSALQQSFAPRLAFLQKKYLRLLAGLPLSDRSARFSLWQQYRADYLRWTKEDV